jgi:RNA polymerase sigma-70 factor (ECF subfamily)
VDAERFAADAVGLHARLVRVVLATCGDRVLAEESAQEALVRAWERVDRGEHLRSLEAWSITVALNWSRSQLRRRGAERRAVDRLGRRNADAPSSDPQALADDVAAAVLELPERQRQVVVLHYLLDLDLATIADIAGISVGGVKNALHHGRATLERRLAVADPVDPEVRP